jgi:hypothetical protein
MSPLQPADCEPLFIVGCVRSGTTLVRNLLRRQPNVICPEETHYFRYGEPFGTNAYRNTLMKSKVLDKHREIDGLSPEVFSDILKKSKTRGELLCRHVDQIARLRGLETYKWFDKTPQNIYGLALMMSEFPKARYLHLVRNPLNVVASLKLGKVIHVADVDAACNYWLEAVSIIKNLKQALGPALMELKYEDLTSDPVPAIESLLHFSGLGNRTDIYKPSDTHAENDQYVRVMSREEQERVVDRCGELAATYGYEC